MVSVKEMLRQGENIFYMVSTQKPTPYKVRVELMGEGETDSGIQLYPIEDRIETGKQFAVNGEPAYLWQKEGVKRFVLEIQPFDSNYPKRVEG